MQLKTNYKQMWELERKVRLNIINLLKNYKNREISKSELEIKYKLNR